MVGGKPLRYEALSLNGPTPWMFRRMTSLTLVATISMTRYDHDDDGRAAHDARLPPPTGALAPQGLTRGRTLCLAGGTGPADRPNASADAFAEDARGAHARLPDVQRGSRKRAGGGGANTRNVVGRWEHKTTWAQQAGT